MIKMMQKNLIFAYNARWVTSLGINNNFNFAIVPLSLLGLNIKLYYYD
jgi:hypothetical protein